MMMPIGSITTGALPLADARPTPAGAARAGASPFSDSLNALISSVDESAGEANNAIGNMMEGTGDVHSAMIAMQKAENSLQLTVQVRNKLVQAYQDVMRMTI